MCKRGNSYVKHVLKHGGDKSSSQNCQLGHNWKMGVFMQLPAPLALGGSVSFIHLSIRDGFNPCWFGLILVDSGWYGLIRVDTGWYGLIRADTGWYRLIRVDTSWYGLIRVDLGLYRLIQVDTGWYWLIQNDTGRFGWIWVDSGWEKLTVLWVSESVSQIQGA